MHFSKTSACRALLYSFAILLLIGCGSHVDFETGRTPPPGHNSEEAGHNGDATVKTTTAAATGTPSKLPTDGNLLLWQWPCGSSQLDPSTLPPTMVTISGPGTHPLESHKFSHDTAVAFRGSICRPAQLARDIIFAVDVSGSMETKDPKQNGTCGRKQALEQIVANITAQKGDVRYGIVTFNSKVVSKSSVLFSSGKDLFADLSSASDLASKVCSFGGGTNFSAALGAVENLLLRGRSNTLKEVYFISDGEPEDKDAAKATASRLRDGGIVTNGNHQPVTIATVLLGDQDSDILQKDISSVGSDGQPIYALARNSTQLAEKLNLLAKNEIADTTLRYKFTNTAQWQKISLNSFTKDYDFVTPSFKLSDEGLQRGLQVELEYSDLHNNKFLFKGEIKWSDES